MSLLKQQFSLKMHEKGGQQSAGSMKRAGSVVNHQFHRMLQLPHQMHACFPILVIFAMAGPVYPRCSSLGLL